MPSELICPDCGSHRVAWDQAMEEFLCVQCNTYFGNEDQIEQYFYKLDLVDWQLDTIPGWVFPRWYLKNIDLSSEPNDSFHAPFCNRINDIPPEIRFLVYLEKLDISHNNITVVPPEIGQCRSLRELYLGRNLISYLPDEIGNLKNLEDLGLAFNQLDYLPPGIGGLTNLIWLGLDENDIRLFPNEIGNLQNLEILSASSNKLAELPPGVGNLKKLVII